MRLRTAPVFLAFLAMGFGDAVGPFVGLARGEFQLSNAAAALIPFVGFSMFGLLSVPVGLVQDRVGKKAVLLAGLLVALVGLLNASFGLTSFPRFLLTVLLLGAGAAVLQVAGNPLMRDVSAAGRYARNLSLAQFVKAIGSLSGPLIPVVAARAFGVGWEVIFPIYAVAVGATALAVGALRVEERRAAERPATFGSCLALLRRPFVAAMVGAIFLYVGAEVSVSAGLPLLFAERWGVDVEREGLLGTGLFFAALTVGRFGGGVVLHWASPRRFLAATCLLSLAGFAVLLLPERGLAAAGIVLLGLGFANVFPLVFSLAVEAMPERANELSGLMVTAIVGGAFLPPVAGWIADRSSVATSLAVPAAAVLYVTWIAFGSLPARSGRVTAHAAGAE